MTKRKVFHSFHYSKDSWRVSQVRNIGVIEGNSLVSSNEWEQVKRKGENAIKKWIDGNMRNRSCLIVLIGEETASRKWCKYEIKHAWEMGKGIVGIYIHDLKDACEKKSRKGANPFDSFYVNTFFNKTEERNNRKYTGDKLMSNVCKAYDSPYLSSTDVYDYIKEHIEAWVEEAIEIRNNYPK